MLICTSLSGAEAIPSQLVDLAESHEEFSWSLEVEKENGNDELYKEPQEAHFRKLYELDAANRSEQTWSNYHAWIKTFYAGNWLATGWYDSAGKLCEGIPSQQDRAQMRRYLNVLGRIIASEWAKDNSVRRIDNNDLRRWAARLEAAKTNDDTGAKRLSEVRQVAKLVSVALAERRKS